MNYNRKACGPEEDLLHPHLESEDQACRSPAPPAAADHADHWRSSEPVPHMMCGLHVLPNAGAGKISDYVTLTSHELENTGPHRGCPATQVTGGPGGNSASRL